VFEGQMMFKIKVTQTTVPTSKTTPARTMMKMITIQPTSDLRANLATILQGPPYNVKPNAPPDCTFNEKLLLFIKQMKVDFYDLDEFDDKTTIRCFYKMLDRFPTLLNINGFERYKYVSHKLLFIKEEATNLQNEIGKLKWSDFRFGEERKERVFPVKWKYIQYNQVCIHLVLFIYKFCSNTNSRNGSQQWQKLDKEMMHRSVIGILGLIYCTEALLLDYSEFQQQIEWLRRENINLLSIFWSITNNLALKHPIQSEALNIIRMEFPLFFLNNA